MVKMTLMIISSEVQASLCEQAFHPKFHSISKLHSLEAIRFCIVETICSTAPPRNPLSGGDSCSRQPASSGIQSPYMALLNTLHHRRSLLLLNITVQVESKFQTLVAQQHGVCVQNSCSPVRMNIYHWQIHFASKYIPNLNNIWYVRHHHAGRHCLTSIGCVWSNISHGS